MKQSLMEIQDEWEEDTQKGKYLTFSLGDTYYGFDIECVTEIIGIQPITVIPELPGFIKGISSCHRQRSQDG